MSTESEILTEVEALKARFPDTKALYREVCALLFFRHGITPTTGKLYQYVQKGSMGVPTEALRKFWDELRSKARVEIDHPDLPPALASTAAEAIAEIWRQATTAARQELAALRTDVQAGLDAAKEELRLAAEASGRAATTEASLREEIAGAVHASNAMREELETERRSHAATGARLQELQRHHDETKLQLDRQREQFTRDLELSKQAAEAASAHLEAAERRAALEVDQERQAKAKLEKSAEALRSALAAAEAKARELELGNAAEAVRRTSEITALQAALAASQSRVTEADARAQSLQVLLDEQRTKATEASAEASTLRSVLAQARTATPQAKRSSRAAKSG